MTQENKLHALLIGINYYFPNQLAGGVSFGHLNGCVSDVEAMEAFLKTRLKVQDGQIIKLTASHGEDRSQPAEPKELWPTYENIKAGFQKLYDMAKEGDQVLIHYSGHGGRAKTVYSHKSGGYDEGFAPTNIGTSASRYLRDLQMAQWLQELSDKGLTVTAILDCCHSGGMTRGDAVPRGNADVDIAQRENDQSAELDSLTGIATRAATHKMTGLAANNDWVVVAACRPQESAYEYTVEGSKRGALTYWLLDTLEGNGLSLSYEQLHQRLIGRIQSKFARQRPQLHGNGKRAVFGKDAVTSQFDTTVLKYKERRKEVTLNAGVAQGVRKGAEFAIFPLDATDLTDLDASIARANVVEEGAADSIALVAGDVKEGHTIEPGTQAVLVNPASVTLTSLVRLQTEEEGALSDDAQSALKSAYAASQLSGFLEWTDEDESAEFIVAAMDGNYEIWDGAGEVIPRINPPIALTDADGAQKVISRLIHLTRYRNVLGLSNNAMLVKGAPSVTLEWLNVDPDHVFAAGDDASLRVRNDSQHDIEIAILLLNEDWSITQIYPEHGVQSYTFAPGEADTLEFETFLEDDHATEKSIFKVFATVNGTNFQMLELPSLDQPLEKSATRSASADNELEQLLSQVVDTLPSTRAIRAKTNSGRQWTTTQVELVVER